MTDDDPDHRERPDLIDLGDRDGTRVAAVLSDLAGVTLSGTGTDDVLRPCRGISRARSAR